MPQQAVDGIANQIFIGCPWKTLRKKYERAIDSLKRRYPISFVIVGRDDGQDAEDLLAIIKGRLLTSSYAIFDATGGNANVSLEYGFAEANEIPRALYLCTHAASTKASKDSAIISDLAGKRRNHYTQEQSLQKLLGQAAKNHKYTQRFERFIVRDMRSLTKTLKTRTRRLALKIIHTMDGQRSIRRADVVQTLLADPAGYKRSEIDLRISRLHRAELIRGEPDRYSTVSIA